MKKSLLVLSVFALLIAVFLCGASAFGKKTVLCIEAEGDKRYYEVQQDFRTVAQVVFLYGGDYEKYFEKVYLGNYEDGIRNLNDDFYCKMDELCRSRSVPPVDAIVTVEKEGFSYAPSVVGKKADRKKFFLEIARSLRTKEPVELTFFDDLPFVTEEDLRAVTKERGTFFTDYSTSADGRKNNIALACEKIDCAMVPAGEVFSFNDVVGPRTEENGFRKAKIIVDGAFVEGVGGGVCQVSTTLFDAWLRAGLSVVRAAAHSLPVGYVEPSLDAMVSSSSDLLLKNDSDYPVYIRAKADGKRVRVEVFGEPCRYRVALRSVTEKILPADYKEIPYDGEWQEGEGEKIVKKAHDGRVSVAYRDYFLGDELVRTEFLRRNVYQPQAGEKAIRQEYGTKDQPSSF